MGKATLDESRAGFSDPARGQCTRYAMGEMPKDGPPRVKPSFTARERRTRHAKVEGHDTQSIHPVDRVGQGAYPVRNE